MEQTVIAAVARRKLDFSLEGLTPDELAALARVSRKSIVNCSPVQPRPPRYRKEVELELRARSVGCKSVPISDLRYGSIRMK